ncbi:catechol 1,2-dioxygenase [Bacillus thermophilus]|uniref:Catechol 1,2-dioxygenase n=1 Tax=Siminovitchia thermophila TaxID=1245522 RepID=A0ABS2R668_9BACI|nr:dioxygenase [Siminovitchia thermophila]MBM7714106.1 catechol 1,2-dioxygenase [Siminovitchia thermophila]ONK21696.1 catechol 1,2-dioxygenase [Bacillus sp. VT-16-64]
MQKQAVQKNERVEEVFHLFVKHVQNFLKEAKLNHEEYTNFVNWADRLGRAGELPLYTDVFLESHVLKAMYTNKPGTQPSLLGPYFIEGSPLLKKEPGKPLVLTQRHDEAGEVLMFKGNVSSTDGMPLPNTRVEMWQNDHSGKYSAFDADAPRYNLRGHFYTDENGDFEVKTIVPVPYSIPADGPTGEFLKYMDQHPMRPAHLHLMFEAEGHETLITQVFFEGDEWLETDVADGVRTDLVTKLEDKSGHKEASLNFVMRPQ